ncbi:MAG: dynamin family protein [Bacteroidales bacterium]|nr:dynamin family protein [Bacteroidales bacterium]
MRLEDFKNVILSSDSAIKALSVIDHTEVKEYTARIIERFNEFNKGGEVLSKDSEMLKLGVVGQVKAGKSSFLNSLFFNGDDVLPKASTPMTAGLTVLEYSDVNELEVEYYTNDEWQGFVQMNSKYEEIVAVVKKNNLGAPDSVLNQEIGRAASEQMISAHELVTMCKPSAKAKIGGNTDKVPFSGVAGIQAKLNEYVGADGVYTPVVKSLYIHLNDERLKGVRIVDTPGVNDPIQSRGNRTNEFLESCHAVFFLSYAGKFLDATDVQFMNERVGGKGIGAVLLLASKFDSVLQDLGFQYRGSVHEGDINYAVEEAKRSEKMLLDQHRSQFTNPQLAEKIILDFTAGIGYSIYKKPMSELDPVEKNVVKQFNDFYPGMFDSEVNLKEFFKILSNIDDIRDKYLNNVFVAKKDEIIQHKIDEYFSSQSEEIGEIVSDAIKAMDEKKRQLNTLGLEDIYAQKAQQEKLFSDLKGCLENLISNCQNGLQNKVTELWNLINTPRLMQVPTSDSFVTASFDRTLSSIRGKGKSNFLVQQVDGSSLVQEMLSMASKYMDDWQSEWKKHFDSSKREVMDQAIKKLGEISAKDSKFDDSYFYRLLEKVLLDMDSCRILNVRDELNNFIDSIEKIGNNQSLRITDQSYDCEEEYVQSQLDDLSKRALAKAKESVNEQIKPFTTAIKSAADRNARRAIETLEKVKGNIVEKLKGEGQKKLDELEAEIKDKENTIITIDLALSHLNIVKTNFPTK